MKTRLITTILTITALLLTPSTLLAVPTDEFYANQWGVRLVMEKPGDPTKTVWDIPNADGNGIHVYVMDTGVQRFGGLSHEDHKMFLNDELIDIQFLSVTPSPFSFTYNSFDLSSVNYEEGDYFTDNTDGHGTGIYGLIAAPVNDTGIAGMAPNAKVISIKAGDVAGLGGNTTNAAVETIAGLDYVELNGISPYVVNVSRRYIAEVEACAEVASILGSGNTILVATAGNSNSSILNAPANCSLSNRLISVGASNDLDSRHGSSNYSTDLDVFAPGVDIYSTSKVSAASYANFTGTSFAAPIVSSAAAILMGCGMPASNIEAALKASGPAITFPGGSAPRINIYTALENANQTPTGINSDYINLRENLNTGGGLNIATLNIQDSDICDQHQYQILAVNDHNLFTLSGADNRQLILSDGELDYERKNQYQITIRATDHFGASVDQILVMAIDNINEAPQINTQTYNLDENSHNNTIVGIINASDPDSGDSINYSITAGNNNNAFDISPTTGQLWVNNSAALDYETQTEFALTIAVEDTEGLQNSALVTIKLNNIDEPAPTSGTTSPENNPSSGGGLIGFYALLYLFVVYGLRRFCHRDPCCEQSVASSVAIFVIARYEAISCHKC